MAYGGARDKQADFFSRRTIGEYLFNVSLLINALEEKAITLNNVKRKTKGVRFSGDAANNC